jgi:hypothetical protein
VIWTILFYIWLAGYILILLAIAKTYKENYLREKDCIAFAAIGVGWPFILAVYFFVRCL